MVTARTQKNCRDIHGFASTEGAGSPGPSMWSTRASPQAMPIRIVAAPERLPGERNANPALDRPRSQRPARLKPSRGSLGPLAGALAGQLAPGDAQEGGL